MPRGTLNFWRTFLAPPRREPLTADSCPSGLGAALLESDAAYFEAAARIESLPGAKLAWMEGLHTLAAAGVIQRVASGLGGLSPEAWLDRVEAMVQKVGRTIVRLYLTTPHPALEPLLQRRGYRARAEIGFVGPPTSRPRMARPPRVTLRRVRLESDWALKHALHCLADTGPDGHPALPSEWTAMERRKVEAGYMQSYLIYSGSELCGTVSLARRVGLDRMKNLVLHPGWRRQGIGTALIVTLGESAACEERVLGTIALENTPGEALYHKCGLRPAARQTEWIRSRW